MHCKPISNVLYEYFSENGEMAELKMVTVRGILEGQHARGTIREKNRL